MSKKNRNQRNILELKLFSDTARTYDKKGNDTYGNHLDKYGDWHNPIIGVKFCTGHDGEDNSDIEIQIKDIEDKHNMLEFIINRDTAAYLHSYLQTYLELNKRNYKSKKL